MKKQPQYQYVGMRAPWFVSSDNPIVFACTRVRSHHHLKEIITRLRRATVRSGFRYTMLLRGGHD